MSFGSKGKSWDALGIPLRQLASLDFLALRAQLDLFLALGVDVFVAMWIGGLVVGSIAAAITYPITLAPLKPCARVARRGETSDEV